MPRYIELLKQSNRYFYNIKCNLYQKFSTTVINDIIFSRMDNRMMVRQWT